MKNLALFVLLAIFSVLMLSSCKRKTFYPAEVNFLSEDVNQGTIKLVSKGYAGRPFDAGVIAEKNAFEAILFRGVPGSQQVRPLIPNEIESREKNASFYKKFFDEEGYKQFILSTGVSDTKLMRRNFRATRDLNINLRSLRTHLEQNGVARGFGW